MKIIRKKENAVLMSGYLVIRLVEYFLAIRLAQASVFYNFPCTRCKGSPIG